MKTKGHSRPNARTAGAGAFNQSWNPQALVSKLAKASSAVALGLALVACGGGGGPPAQQPAPTNPTPSDPQVEPAVAHAVRGAVSGLQGAGLVLKNNAGDDLAINAD